MLMNLEQIFKEISNFLITLKDGSQMLENTIKLIQSLKDLCLPISQKASSIEMVQVYWRLLMDNLSLNHSMVMAISLHLLLMEVTKFNSKENSLKLKDTSKKKQLAKLFIKELSVQPMLLVSSFITHSILILRTLQTLELLNGTMSS